MQTNLESRVEAALHVAAIMDGNGRWATRQGLPRTAGHRAGVQAVRRVVEAAPDLGIGVLTLFAFSADNWRRPRREVVLLPQAVEEHRAARARGHGAHVGRVAAGDEETALRQEEHQRLVGRQSQNDDDRGNENAVERHHLAVKDPPYDHNDQQHPQDAEHDRDAASFASLRAKP